MCVFFSEVIGPFMRRTVDVSDAFRHGHHCQGELGPSMRRTVYISCMGWALGLTGLTSMSIWVTQYWPRQSGRGSARQGVPCCMGRGFKTRMTRRTVKRTTRTTRRTTRRRRRRRKRRRRRRRRRDEDEEEDEKEEEEEEEEEKEEEEVDEE